MLFRKVLPERIDVVSNRIINLIKPISTSGDLALGGSTHRSQAPTAQAKNMRQHSQIPGAQNAEVRAAAGIEAAFPLPAAKCDSANM